VPKRRFRSGGIEDLPCLVRVHATIDWKDASERGAGGRGGGHESLPAHPNYPVLELNRSKSRAAAAGQSVIVINSLEEWEKQIGCSKWVLIHFTTRGCAASLSISPVFADLAKCFPGVVFLKVDVAELARIASRYDIKVVPTFLFLKVQQG
jgi:thioredoxin 1